MRLLAHQQDRRAEYRAHARDRYRDEEHQRQHHGEQQQAFVAEDVEQLAECQRLRRQLVDHAFELLAEGLPEQVELLDTDEDVLAYRRGSFLAVLNTAGEPVQVPVPAGASLLEATAPGAEVAGELVTVPPAATVWLRVAG